MPLSGETLSSSTHAWTWLEKGTAPQGIRASGVRTGIKTAGTDLALIVSDGPACGAAVFTPNQFCAPPVLVSREHAADGRLRAIIANSGCANACTGEQGLADAREMARLTAAALGFDPTDVLVASTGIIGHPLPMELIRSGIPQAAAALERNLDPAALAILTTDTSTKQASLWVDIGGRPVIISGMCKGAGMVAPRMATVFGFFATDAVIEPDVLQDMFRRAMRRSFNRVTVDGDTSTNDTGCILSSGAAGNAPFAVDSPEAVLFESALSALAENLARQLARGGEGATHLVTVEVSGCATEADAEVIAMSICNSPLVKTAIFGKDPNWGRIAMAAGKAGVAFDQALATIVLNGTTVLESGMPAAFDPETLRATFERDEVRINVDLGAGAASATAWTCDFSYEYVEINAEYHT